MALENLKLEVKMKRVFVLGILFAGWVVVMPVSPSRVQGQAADERDDSESKIKRGFAITPVPLNLEGKKRALVGLGSYIVNAQGGCNDCHRCPSYAPGHNPFAGGDGQINATNYLAGGVPFGPTLKSANITPNAEGNPNGLSLEQFVQAIRTGTDP